MLRSKPIFTTFVDFKRAYDFIDTEGLINAMREYGIDKKTTNLIKLMLPDTFLRVQFLGKIRDHFEIKTGLRQGDSLPQYFLTSY